MSLSGPSKTIVVEPLELPEEAEPELEPEEEREPAQPQKAPAK